MELVEGDDLSARIARGPVPVADAPSGDKRKFRDELMWQEYARHVYARVGTGTRRPLRYEPRYAPLLTCNVWPVRCRAPGPRMTREGRVVMHQRMQRARHEAQPGGDGTQPLGQLNGCVRVRLEVEPPSGLRFAPAVHGQADEVRTVFEVADDRGARLAGRAGEAAEWTSLMP